ncbi:NAD-dependent epimerase/dehydratase family protein [Sinisalibacter lacisalsi]|uniref:Nucleoside-diphosphate sugar epimerase n=1 Tax=Sinisalibacter lacisalsi TaxID=1526570 RepID=A0ABQ1QGR2_9RHOB|nr:NAD(P)-dependent oxidoreductase [Sinisalibacter lacisalsi]GGD25194.1 nucleoside-diphosphate sugar epimerase [Sinisalibacter lacisalsi]
MSRVLVTGGTGFIGRWVVAELRAHGHDVTVFDARPNPSALDELRPGLAAEVRLVSGDIADGSVRDAAQGADGIVHLAGVMTVDAAADPVRAAEINLIGSLHVFEAARAHGIDRIAYVSTAGVFGPDDPIYPQPMTHYGAQKLAIEGAARAYLLDHGLPSIGFRPYIVYGPGQSSGIAAGPSIAIGAAARGEAATIRFSGRVGFVHVRDVAALMVAAVRAPVSGATAYTLCGETTGMDDFVRELRSQAPGAEVTIEGPPLRIPTDLATSPLPTALARVPVTGVSDGIAATLDFYRARRGIGAA